MNDENRFPDQLDAFRVQQTQLERRRELARSLINKGLTQPAGQMVGNIYVANSPLLAFANAAAGSYMDHSANKESTDLAARQQQQNNELLSSIPASGPERVQAQIRAMQSPSLRDVIKAQMGVDEHEAARIEKSEQEAANRVSRAEEAEANRIERGEQLAQDRVSRQELRQTPTVHVSTGGSSGPNRTAGIKAPSGYRYNEDGTALEPIPGGPADKPRGASDGKPLNETQGNATLFGTRMAEADKVLDEVGTDYSPMKLDIARGAEAVPGGSAAVNAALSPKEQKVSQAQRDFINAVLRKESGAAIAQSEFDNARRQYFPQPNDGNEVIEQKRKNRQTAISGMKLIAGPGGKHINAMPQQPTAPKPTVAPGTRGMHKGKSVVMGGDGEWHYE